MHKDMLLVPLILLLLPQCADCDIGERFWPDPCWNWSTAKSRMKVQFKLIGELTKQWEMGAKMQIFSSARNYSSKCTNIISTQFCDWPRDYVIPSNESVTFMHCQPNELYDSCYILKGENEQRFPGNEQGFKAMNITFYPDPIIYDITINVTQSSLSFYGSGMNVFINFTKTDEQDCSKEQYYQIKWNGKNCTRIDVTATSLTCKVDAFTDLSVDDEITVKLGELELFHRASKSEGNSFNLILLIPIIGASIFVLIATVVVVYCIINKHKKMLKNAMPFNSFPLDEPSIQSRFDQLPKDLQDSIREKMIDESAIDLGNSIGSGNFGEVLKAILKKDNGGSSLVALKFFKDMDNKKAFSEFLREATMMCQFQHENVLECYGILLSHKINNIAIVAPYMEGSDLRHYVIENNEKVGFNEIVNFSIQIANGMKYLSQMNFIHRDLAARNCLIDSQHVVKVSDFGLSRTIEYEEDYYRMDDYSHDPLPVRWLAPECFEFMKFTVKTDVWAFGVVMWELCTKGPYPYGNMTSLEIVERIKLGGFYPEKTTEIPNSLYDIMLTCWEFDPGDRTTFSKLIEALRSLQHSLPNPDIANYIEVSPEDDYLPVHGSSSDINKSSISNLPTAKNRTTFRENQFIPDDTFTYQAPL